MPAFSMGWRVEWAFWRQANVGRVDEGPRERVTLVSGTFGVGSASKGRKAKIRAQAAWHRSALHATRPPDVPEASCQFRWLEPRGQRTRVHVL
jgi:hypothetical protein